jgi:hypothetical protein
MDDLLWPHFQPLWRDLVSASSTNILVAGGYGLFLKQRWLSSSASLPTVVPIPNWLDTTPRVTKDVDLVLGLDLIKDANHQKSVVSALTQNGFEASDRESEQRWKFLKRLSRDQLIVVEMHAQRPDPGVDGITATDKRVKHKPSLGEQGVHPSPCFSFFPEAQLTICFALPQIVPRQALTRSKPKRAPHTGAANCGLCDFEGR